MSSSSSHTWHSTKKAHETIWDMEVYFESMFERCISYMSEYDILTDAEAGAVQNILDLSPAVLIGYLANISDDLILSKDDQSNPKKVMNACESIVSHLLTAGGKGAGVNIQQVFLRLQSQADDVVLKTYRYFECLHRISKAHHNILTQVLHVKTH